MTTAAPHVETSAVATELERLYPGRLALLLVPLCGPGHDCAAPGKTPHARAWLTDALARYDAGADRGEHVAVIARHADAGGNVGWAVPPGVVVLDADAAPTVQALGAVLDGAAVQEAARGAHYVVRAPLDAEIRATVALELAPGVRVDVRAGGRSQIVVEPSVHETGVAYSWRRELPEDLAALPELPAEWVARVTAPRESPAGRSNGGKIHEGGRNDYLFRHGCGLRARNRGEAEIHEELHAENERHCDPPLAASEVDAIAVSILGHYAAGSSREREKPPSLDRDPRSARADHDDDDRAGRDDHHDGDPRRFFDGYGLVVPRLGEEIRGLGHVRLGQDGRLYRYRKGVYCGDGEAFVRSKVRRLLADLFKRSRLDEALTYLRADFASVTDRQPEGLINLRSGLLYWRAPTLELRPHDPRVVTTVQVPHAWNPGAKCPLIQKFLIEVLPEDAVELMIEIIGYALLAGNPLRVAILLLGPGRNGKSVLLLVIKALLGAENVSVATLQALAENRFAAAELFGKLANICGDLDARSVKQTDVFKMLTGGDPMLAERKHRDAFTFTPFALPIFSANEPPLSSDQSEAWFDRWLVVPMEKRIAPEQVDQKLAEKLTTHTELEGLLVLAVEGLRRLMARGRFELPASVESARGDYRERLDSVRGFVVERATLHANCWAPRSLLYRAYRTWAQESGRFALSAATFNDHLRRGFVGRVEERKREGTWGWVGIGVLEDSGR